MDIFEQMVHAQVMLVNGVLTTNFGHNPDEDEEFWCFSIYGCDPESMQTFEHYFNQHDMKTAQPYGDGFKVGDNILEFCLLTPVDKG